MLSMTKDALSRIGIWRASHLLDQGRLHNSRKVAGISTGIVHLDMTSRGLPVGLVLLAGRPQSGHQALARQIALNVGQAGSIPVIWFSMQFNAVALIGQFLAHLEADQMLADNHSLTIVDTPRLTMKAINKGLDGALEAGSDHQGLMIVDDLAMLLESCLRGSVDQCEIARELRGMAVARNLSLMVCCGLSRKLENRENKIPRLSDLKALKAFVLEADQVIATHYPYIYEPEIASKDAWEILLLKNRNGPTGGVLGTTTILPWPNY